MLKNTPLKPETRLQIDDNIRMPKFMQVVNGILMNIETGLFKPGDRLPSINETSVDCYLARATVEKAYTSLLKSGHLTSLYRKGFFVAERQGIKRVLFLVSKLNQSNRAIFNSISERLGKAYKVDIYTYEYRRDYLCEILEKQAGNYQHFVLMPHYFGESDAIKASLQKIPNKRIIILDESGSLSSPTCSSVQFGCGVQFQRLLDQNARLFTKYQRLTFVATDQEYIHADWYKAVLNFSAQYNIDCQIVDEFSEAPVEKGMAYILFDDQDLLTCVKETTRRQLRLGTDVGLVAFNDDGYKELLAGGISVITIDVPALARLTTELIIDQQKRQAYIPMKFIRRASL
ncbi:MAG: GntR family transcriptional regulator [Cytophagaceae bacterium]|nr:GntR family transcriptional regulator [Cytophagaceae bacterium]